MTHRPSPRLPGEQRIAGPADLVQAVPYFLGFHPRRSLVLVGLRGGSGGDEHVVTARLDLGDALVPGVVSGTVGRMTSGGAGALVAIVFDDPPDAWDGGGRAPWDALLEQLGPVLSEATRTWRCVLRDVLVTAAGRWWSTSCDAPECCPPEGRALPSAPSAFVAGATVRGVVVQPDREALAATLAPEPDEVRAGYDELLEAAELRCADGTDGSGGLTGGVDDAPTERDEAAVRAICAAARKSTEPGWERPGDATLADLAVALRRVTVRDPVWLLIDAKRLDGRALWRTMSRRLPAPYDAVPAFLFGWASWRHGDGALANIAAERAVGSDPECTAADLLLAALAQGVDPRTFPPLDAGRTGGSDRWPDPSAWGRKGRTVRGGRLRATG